MESLLVAGVNTMVGANFAAQLSEQFDVSTCGWRTARTIAGCRTVDPAIVGRLADLKPQRLVICTSAATSAWDDSDRPLRSDVELAGRWLRAAKDADIAVTLISSDAVFTGPWMFHAENSPSICPSPEAGLLRQIEQLAQELLPEALIIRTNAFGWSSPWLEKLVSDLSADRNLDVDCVRHASPILVNDLIDVTLKGWNAGLAGVYHAAGAERANPAAFAQRLAAEFGYCLPRKRSSASLTNCSSGYGCSETSLQTRKLRRALGIPVPLLSEGLRKLRQLSLNGFRERLEPQSPPARAA